MRSNHPDGILRPRGMFTSVCLQNTAATDEKRGVSSLGHVCDLLVCDVTGFPNYYLRQILCVYV